MDSDKEIEAGRIRPTFQERQDAASKRKDDRADRPKPILDWLLGTASTAVNVFFLPFSLLYSLFSFGWLVLKILCLVVAGWLIVRAVRWLLTPGGKDDTA